jgi:hypothetical protein
MGVSRCTSAPDREHDRGRGNSLDQYLRKVIGLGPESTVAVHICYKIQNSSQPDNLQVLAASRATSLRLLAIRLLPHYFFALPGYRDSPSLLPQGGNDSEAFGWGLTSQ